MHARSTASHAIKNNLKITEFMTEPNIITNKQKAHAIINRHLEHRNLERAEDPSRFNIRPTIGEMAVRVPPLNSQEELDEAQTEVDSKRKPDQQVPHKTSSQPQRQSPMSGSVHFREIKVQQMNKSAQMSVKPGTIHTVQTPVFSQQ
uniref:Spata4 spermatogenesis associated 4 n=1 Tax=Phallusia mammillata TaxID=59560 RepID=A0A6F9DU15_9ASCI|nr:spata4 spermatogenesis associated 4 [Phallusia mammillata]